MYRIRLILMAVPLALTAATVPAGADIRTITELGRWSQASSLAFALDGDRGYLGSGCHLQTLDLSDLDDPVLDQELLFSHIVTDVALDGDHAYVATFLGGLQVVDVSNPAQPIVGSVDGTIVHVALSGNTAFVANAATGLASVNITDPTSPTVISTVLLNGAWDVAVQGTVAYVVSESGLHSIDVSNPGAMSVLDFLPYDPGEEDTRGLFVEGNTAYVTYAAGLRIVDISTPAALDERGLYPFEFIGFDFGVHGGYAYVTNWVDLLLVDVTDPDAPTLYRSYDLGRYGHHGAAIVFDADTAYLSDSHWGLAILDITDPGSINLRSLQEVMGYFEHVARKGDLVAAGAFPYLWLFDVSDPQNPTALASVFPSTLSQDVIAMAIEGDYLYTCFDDRLEIIDVSSPSTPVAGTPVPFGLDALDMVMRMNVIAEPDLALVSYGSQVHAIDVTDPDAPDPLGSLSVESFGWAHQIATDGEHLYVASWGQLLVYFVATITDPPPDSPCGFVNLPFPATEIEELVVDEAHGLVYLAEEAGPIQIIDVSDPCTPDHVGTYVLPPELEDVAVATGPGDVPLLHVLNKIDDLHSGLTVLDMSNPTLPQEVGTFTDIIMAEEIARSGQDVVVTAGVYGYWLLRDDAVVPVLLSLFDARRDGADVVLRWMLGRSDDDARFAVDRESTDGLRVRVTEHPVQGSGTSFELIDHEAPRGELTYWLLEVDADGNETPLGSARVGPTTVAGPLVLRGASPNPFHPSTRIAFGLAEAEQIHLAVYDVAGRHVATLIDAPRDAGEHVESWDGIDAGGRELPSGVYVLRLSAGGEVLERKVVLAR